MAASPGRLTLAHGVGSPYLSAAEIGARVRELGAEIARDYAGEPLVLVAPLRESSVFVADLSRALAVPHRLEFVQLERFAGAGTQRGRAARVLKDLDGSIDGRDVLVVETLVDTGLTLAALLRALAVRSPRTLAVVTLLDRPHRRLVHELPLRYVGFDVPDELFAGYGLGLEERWRALPDLHLLA